MTTDSPSILIIRVDVQTLTHNAHKAGIPFFMLILNAQGCIGPGSRKSRKEEGCNSRVADPDPTIQEKNRLWVEPLGKTGSET